MTKMRHFLMLTICLSLVTAKPSSSEIDVSLVPFIINNSGNSNNNNVVNNGNDTLDGNLVNGNDNGQNDGSGNVSKNRLEVFIINNSGNNNSGNEISNGNDDVSGNLVNGNSNGNNSLSGNVNKRSPRSNVAPFIINNSGNDNQNNSVQNGNDDVDGNLVNGNGNGDNSGSGNVGQDSESLPAHIEASTALSTAQSSDKLLDYIDGLLELVSHRLNEVLIAINIPDQIAILLQRVKNILVNVLLSISDVFHFLQNRDQIVTVSNLINKVDTVTHLMRNKNIKLPEIIISLNDAVGENKDELRLIPDLLQQLLDLLRALV